MGALIPTPNDQEIIAKLNLRFSRSGLNTLRRYQNTSGDSLFGGAGLPPRSLERVSIQLGIYPTGIGGKGRWIYFLQVILKNANNGATYNLIKSILEQAINTPAVDSVVFDVMEDPAAAAQGGANNNYYLYPSNAANVAAPLVSYNSLPGKPIYLVTLVCPNATDIPFGAPEPPPDNGEPINPIVP